MGKLLVSRAAEKYANGEYQEALDIYKTLSSQIGLECFKVNIWLCQKRSTKYNLEPPGGENLEMNLSVVNHLYDKDSLREILLLANSGCYQELYDRVFNNFKYVRNSKNIAVNLLKIAKFLGDSGEYKAEGFLAKRALEMDRSEEAMYYYFWCAERSLPLADALDSLVLLEEMYKNKTSDNQIKRLSKIKRSPIQQLKILNVLLDPKKDAPDPISNRVAYILHNSLPYSSGGYGTRSHGVALGLKAAGVDLFVFTRPGFPLDVKRELDPKKVALEDVIDEVSYIRTLKPTRTELTPYEYIISAADQLESRLRKIRPSIIIAASDYQNALISMIVARRLGIPFCYEVRGMWEITRMSRSPEFKNSAQFKVTQQLEAYVASNAEYVFTLTESMLQDLISRGVDRTCIELLPNSCDPNRFLPRERNKLLSAKLGLPPKVPVIGYVGTFVDYEGLEDLTSACAILKLRGHNFRLLLVGNENASGTEKGPIMQKIIEISKNYGFEDWLVMPGRVPHNEVEDWYSLVDIAPFPRKPWPVCEMVSPMKPLEALAMEKAVVVSSVHALAEMIRDGETGIIFEKGNLRSLADTLEKLLLSPERRMQLGKSGRQWVCKERTWQTVGSQLASRLALLTAATI